METKGKISIMLLITLTMVQSKEDLDTMKELIVEMKMEMNERLFLAEEKLAKQRMTLPLPRMSWCPRLLSWRGRWPS